MSNKFIIYSLLLITVIVSLITYTYAILNHNFNSDPIKNINSVNENTNISNFDAIKMRALPTNYQDVPSWTTLEGLINCSLLESKGYQDGDRVQFKFITTDPKIDDLNRYFTPQFFYLSVQPKAHPNTIFPPFQGQFDDNLTSDLITTHFGVIDCNEHPNIPFVLQIDYDIIRSELITDKIPVSLDFSYIPQDTTLTPTLTSIPLTYVSPGIEKVSNTTASITFVSNIDHMVKPMQSSELSELNEQPQQQFLFQGAISKLTNPINQILIRNFGTMHTVPIPIDTPMTSDNIDAFPHCMVNGIVMNVTVIQNDWGLQDFLVSIPISYTPSKLDEPGYIPIANSGTKQYSSPRKLSQLANVIGQFQDVDIDGGDEDDAEYFFPLDLHFDCNLHSYISIDAKLPYIISISLINSKIPENPPTLTFSPIQHNINIVKIPLRDFRSFRQIQLPRLIVHNIDQPDELHNKNDLSCTFNDDQSFYDQVCSKGDGDGDANDDDDDDQDVIIPMTTTRSFRQLLVPYHSVNIPSHKDPLQTILKGDFISYFQFSYHLTGNMTIFKKENEFINFDIFSLPSQTKIIELRYIMYGYDYNPITNQTIYTSRNIIARGDVLNTRIITKGKHHNNSTEEYPTSNLRFKNFLPDLLPQNRIERMMDNTRYGELQFIITLKHHGLTVNDLLRWPELYPHARSNNNNNSKNLNSNTTIIEPVAMINLFQLGNRTRHGHDGDHPALSTNINTHYTYISPSSYSLFHSIDSFNVIPQLHSESIDESNPTSIEVTGNDGQGGEILNGLSKQYDVILDRYYTLNITFANITTPTPLHSFYLSLPTAEYSFVGNYTTCIINNDPVIVTPISISSGHNSTGPVVYHPGWTYTTSTLFINNTTIFPHMTYTFICPESIYLKPSILLGAHDQLYNNNIPLIMTTENPVLAHGSTIITSSTLGQLHPVYTGMTFIQFKDHLLPPLFLQLIGFIVIFVVCGGLVIFIYFFTRCCCQVVPKGVKIPDPPELGGSISPTRNTTLNTNHNNNNGNDYFDPHNDSAYYDQLN